MSNPEFKLSCQLMRRAISEEVISVTPKALLKFRDGKNDMFAKLMETVQRQYKNSLVKSPWLGRQSLWQLPTTRRYNQSREPQNAPLTQPSTAAWMVELARFLVPYGSIGIIKSFEQYVSQDQTVLSRSMYWGDPFVVSGLRWYFRLSPDTLNAAPWLNVSGVSAIPDYLPGIPYDDLGNTDDLWFPAGSSASANIHLPIPGGKMLRVICLVAASETASTVACKLAGTIQSETNRDASFVAKTTW